MSNLNSPITKPKDRILTSYGQELGTVKLVRGERILVEDARFWLPETAIILRENGTARLTSDYDFLGNGGKSEGRNRGLLGLISSVTFGTAAAVTLVALQNKDLRQKIKASLGELITRVIDSSRALRSEARASGGAHSSAAPASSTTPQAKPATDAPRPEPTFDANRSESVQDDIPPFSSLDLSKRAITEVEREVVAFITRAFPQHDLRVNAIGVHRLEGGEVATLRFTLDEVASSDLTLKRVESAQETPSALASEVIEDLRSQLPPPPREE